MYEMKVPGAFCYKFSLIFCVYRVYHIWMDDFVSLFLVHNIPSPTSEPASLNRIIHYKHWQNCAFEVNCNWLDLFFKMFHYFLKDKFRSHITFLWIFMSYLIHILISTNIIFSYTMIQFHCLSTKFADTWKCKSWYLNTRWLSVDYYTQFAYQARVSYSFSRPLTFDSDDTYIDIPFMWRRIWMFHTV